MMLRNFSHDKQLEFLKHFHQLPSIDPQHTNHDLIDALFDAWQERNRTQFNCRRRSGVTRTLIEWAKWIDHPILVITNDSWPWKQAGIHTKTWLNSFIGLRPRPEIVLMDNPMHRKCFESIVMRAKFESWLNYFQYPAFCVNQLEQTP